MVNNSSPQPCAQVNKEEVTRELIAYLADRCAPDSYPSLWSLLKVKQEQVVNLVNLMETWFGGHSATISLGLGQMRYGKQSFLLADKVLEMLNTYGLSPSSITSATTDNEPSVDMTCKLLGMPRLPDMPHVLSIMFKASLAPILTQPLHPEGKCSIIQAISSITRVINQHHALVWETVAPYMPPSSSSKPWTKLAKVQNHRYLNLGLLSVSVSVIQGEQHSAKSAQLFSSLSLHV